MANQYRSVLASGGASTGGDALPAEVLSGKTFTNDNGAQTGTMTNNGAVTQTLAAGDSYTIPEGYHNGSGIVTADTPEMKSVTTRFYNDQQTVSCATGDLIIAIVGGPDYTASMGSIVSGATMIGNAVFSGSDGNAAIYKATATSVSINLAGTSRYGEIVVIG